MGVQKVQEMQKAPSGIQRAPFLHFVHFLQPHRRKIMKRPKLPPWSGHHEPWCAVFKGKSCDCDDGDDRRPRRRRPLSGGGAPAPKREKQKELEDA